MAEKITIAMTLNQTNHTISVLQLVTINIFRKKVALFFTCDRIMSVYFVSLAAICTRVFHQLAPPLVWHLDLKKKKKNTSTTSYVGFTALIMKNATKKQIIWMDL